MRRKVAKRSVSLLDMPLPKGRVAKSRLVFGEGHAVLEMGNLEESVCWKLDIGRTRTTKAEDIAATFSPFGARHCVVLKDVPAMPAAAPPPGAPAIDGLTEFGLQTDDDHEYFVSKFGDLVGVLRVKRNAAGGWSAGLAKTLLPRVLSTEAVKNGLMPPAGHSGLPKSLESVVPDEYRYWQASGPEAIQMRDALVESGFFTEDTIKAVDGELRKVDVRYFVYEPPVAKRDVEKVIKHEKDGWHVYSEDQSKHLGGPYDSKEQAVTRLRQVEGHKEKSLAAKLHGIKAFADLAPAAYAPMAEDDWLEKLDAGDRPDTCAVLSPPDRTVSAREMARAVSTLKGHFLLEHDDTKATRAEFARVGQLFKLAGEPHRIFCSSFAPIGKAVVWTAKAADGSVKKTVDVQGIKVSIDRPVGFVQTGKDADGNDWSRTYSTDYGFIPRTNGGDGGSVDVFVGDNPQADTAFWVSQKKADGSFDEFKVFLGFDALSQVLTVWKAHIPQRFMGDISSMPVSQMKALLNLDPTEVAKAVRSSVVKVAGLSYEQLRSLVGDAINKAYAEEDTSNTPDGCCGPAYYYVDDLFDDKAVFCRKGKSLMVGFSYANGAVTLQGDPVEVLRSWKPIGDVAAPPVQMRATKRTLKLARNSVQKDQQYVLGIVLEPDIVDAQNDTYDADAIRGAFEKFAEEYRNVGLMHKQVINDKVKIVDNYIAPSDFQLGDTTIKKGTWLMGVRVQDPALWSEVKDGAITGFSIGGSAIRRPASQGV